MDNTVFIILLCLTGAALLFTLFLTFRTRRFVSRGITTTGKITRITMEQHEFQGYGSDHQAETIPYYTPHVEFHLPDGNPVTFASRVSHPRSPLYKEGDPVTVVYDPQQPSTTAEIAGAALWRSTIFAAIGTFILALITIFGKACA